MELPRAYDVLRYLSIFAPLLILVRLSSQRLLRTRPYTAFASMITVGLLRDVILLLPSDYRSHSYALAWEITLPFLLLAQAVAAVATYAAIASLYAKIGAFAVRLYGGALAATAIGCCIGLPFETRHIAGVEASVRSLFLLDRWMNSLMAGGLILAVVYLARFPRPLRVMPSNLMLHTTLLSAYYALYSIVPFLLNLVPLGQGLWVQVVLLTAVLALYVCWITGLSAEGERTEAWPEIDPRTLVHIEARHRAILEFGATVASSALRHAAGRR